MYKSGVYGLRGSRGFKLASEAGIDVAFTDQSLIEKAREAGLTAYLCLWTFKVPERKEAFKIENLYGKKVFWNGSGCPNNPELRKATLELIKKIQLKVDGVVLDGVRFPSFGNGRKVFLSCFCEHCKEKAENFGFDIEKIRAGLRESFRVKPSSILNDPDFSHLIEFRCKSIAEFAEEVKKVTKKELGAALFAPSLAPFVGQDYEKLSNILDFIQPMVYHKGRGPACINYELEKFSRDFKLDLGKAYRVIGYERFSPPSSYEGLTEGLPDEVIRFEIDKAKKLTKKSKLTPILFLVDSGKEEIRRLVEIVNGTDTDGVVYFGNKDMLERMR